MCAMHRIIILLYCVYESCKYPGHYIRWYYDTETVDCEVTVAT